MCCLHLYNTKCIRLILPSVVLPNLLVLAAFVSFVHHHISLWNIICCTNTHGDNERDSHRKGLSIEMRLWAAKATEKKHVYNATHMISSRALHMKLCMRRVCMATQWLTQDMYSSYATFSIWQFLVSFELLIRWQWPILGSYIESHTHKTLNEQRGKKAAEWY